MGCAIMQLWESLRDAADSSPQTKRPSVAALMKGKGDMVKQIKISNFNEVKNIMNAASRCYNDIGVHDAKGSIADAKRILGLMSLDYTHPVLLVSEDEEELERVYKALN